ncbi:MAG: ABC transporter substrate-binding protein [Deltaproteobacteria bacterium]|nr:ABC transporter substrate-binding protein [Deltaproteobacteria bacterium]
MKAQMKSGPGKLKSLARGLGILLLSLTVGKASAENVRVGTASINVTMIPMAVARERGFFQQEGLNVELVLMPAALNIKVLLSRDIDYATTVGAAVIAAVRGIDVRVVMLFIDRPLFDLVGSPKIHSVAELKGRTVSISSRGGIQDAILRRMLQQSSLDPAQVTVLTMAVPSAIVAAIKSERVAAGLLNPPYNFLAYRDGLKNLGSAGSFMRLSSAGIVAMREKLERNPDQIRRMARALIRAQVFVKEQKPAVMPIMKRFLGIKDDELLSQIYDYYRASETADGKIDTALAAETIRDALVSERIAKEVSVEHVFDFSYLPPRR